MRIREVICVSFMLICLAPVGCSKTKADGGKAGDSDTSVKPGTATSTTPTDRTPTPAPAPEAGAPPPAASGDCKSNSEKLYEILYAQAVADASDGKSGEAEWMSPHKADIVSAVEERCQVDHWPETFSACVRDTSTRPDANGRVEFSCLNKLPPDLKKGLQGTLKTLWSQRKR